MPKGTASSSLSPESNRVSRSMAAQLVHASPGRLRFKVPREVLTDEGKGFRPERALARARGVREVRLNPAARTVTVTYDPDAMDLEGLLANLAAAGILVRVEPARSSTAAERPVALSGLIADVAAGADQRLATLTGGTADLRTLVPVGFAALALREVLAGRAGAAPWYALAWYAFDSFWKLRRRSEPSSDNSPLAARG